VECPTRSTRLLKETIAMNINNEYDLDTAEIRALAFELWQARGCPDGSPETDWLCAEELIRESGTSMDLMAA
jgi:hypothetical protein